MATAAEEFDGVIRDALEGIIGSPLPPWSWDKATLPPSLGGLGLRSAVIHAPAAYLGSLGHTRSLVEEILGHKPPTLAHVEEAVASLAASAERPEWVSLDTVNVSLAQRPLSQAIDHAGFTRLLDSAPTTRARALCQSSALPKAGAWLGAMPSPALGLHLRDGDCRKSLRYWLGVPLYGSERPCQYVHCRGQADTFGHHQVGCGGDGDRIYRHNLLRDALYSVARISALGPLKEVPGLIPGSLSRPADLYLPYWRRGRPAAMDVTVVSPLQKGLVGRAAETQGHALSVATRRKVREHEDSCQEESIDFVPLAVETLGGWHADAIDNIKAIALAQGSRLGTPPMKPLHGCFSGSPSPFGEGTVPCGHGAPLSTHHGWME